MQTATLIVSSLALVTSAGTLLVMLKVRSDVLQLKAEVDAEIATVKTKVNHNTKVIKAAVNSMDLEI